MRQECSDSSWGVERGAGFRRRRGFGIERPISFEARNRNFINPPQAGESRPPVNFCTELAGFDFFESGSGSSQELNGFRIDGGARPAEWVKPSRRIEGCSSSLGDSTAEPVTSNVSPDPERRGDKHHCGKENENSASDPKKTYRIMTRIFPSQLKESLVTPEAEAAFRTSMIRSCLV